MVTIPDMVAAARREFNAAEAAFQRSQGRLSDLREKFDNGAPVRERDVNEAATARDAAKIARDEAAAKLANLEAEQAEEERIVRLQNETHPTGATRGGGTSTVPIGYATTHTRGGIYNPQAEREGLSFVRDVVNASTRGDVAARDRLARHTQAEFDRLGWSMRDGTTTNYSGLVVPQYLTDLVAPNARAGRPFADNCCTHHPLPPEGLTVNLSRITTGSTATVQAAQLDAVSETDIDDTLLTVNVRTISGAQDVSRQALERGTGVDALIVSDLMAAYHTELDRSILNDDGTLGTHLGVRSVVGLSTVTYTSAGPTAAELYPKLFDALQQTQLASFRGASHIVMHPRRWWWLAAQVGTSQPFLQVAGISTNQGGAVNAPNYQGAAGSLAGIPVILDANIPVTSGAGTNQDTILVVTKDELHLWETPNAPLLIRADTAPKSLAVSLVVYGFSAFTAGRVPAANCAIDGTGLVTPTFA